MSTSSLIVPYRYAIAEEGVHRSAYPVERNFRFLKRLKLKTILSLVPTAPSGPLAEFCQTHSIHMFHNKVDIYKEKNPLTNAAAVQALEIIINPDNHPILVHCMNGAEVTGMVIMCLRKLQIWSLPFATMEFSRFLREGIIEQDQTDFLDRFSSEIALPPRLPQWLWEGKLLPKRHPTIKLKVVDTEPAAPANTSSQKNNQAEFKKKMDAALLTGSEVMLPELHNSEDYNSRVLQALALEVFENPGKIVEKLFYNL